MLIPHYIPQNNLITKSENMGIDPKPRIVNYLLYYS